MSLLHNRWLAEQIPGWEREGIVTAAGARLLRERYGTESGGSLAQLIVGAVGAVLIGTGLIAVLAYNWDDFPRWVRLLLALGPLAASQAVSGWVLKQAEAARPWQREAAAAMQAAAAGAALALVSQIYNLPGRWPDFLFWWCVVSLPLAWVLRSQAVAIAYLIGITVWTVAQAAEQTTLQRFVDGGDVRLWFPLLLAGILPLWPGPGLRDWPAAGGRTVLAASALVGLIAVAAFASNRPSASNQAFFWLAMLSSAAVLLVPLSPAGIAEPLALKPQVQLGGLALIVMALFATYEEPARELVESVGFALPLGWCWLLLAVLAGFAVLAFRQGRFAVLAVAAVTVLPVAVAPLSPPAAGGWPVAIASSCGLLAMAVALIALEFLGRQGAARIGAALITLLVILRMADANVSLLVKGLAFIVIGIGFLGFNLFISRSRTAPCGAARP